MIQALLERYASIPDELKAVPNWCLAGPDKAPYFVAPNEIVRANVTDPRTWKTFEATLHDMVATGAPDIGFVLTTHAGFTCIDMDVKDESNAPTKPETWTTEADKARYAKICEVFDSYTELSRSGKGAHLWLRGSIGAGARRDGIEVYSQERFMICTGKAFNTSPIGKFDEMLTLLVEEVRGANYKGPGALVELEPTEEDAVVWDRASNAANAEKFNKLVRGEWQGEYPSQSEADLALMSMFTFYSKSNSQCRKLFRATGLGQRTKAVKNDKYLNFTLEIIRGRQAREAIIDQRGEEMARALVQQLQTSSYADVAAAHVAAHAPAPPLAPSTDNVPGLDWPPGVTGALAKFIYHSAPRPVKEVAIIAALGFVAGVAGKAYNIYNSGLNMYLILVGRSGVGKEAMHSGLSLVCEKLRETAPQAQSFIDFTEYVSGPALKKACSAQNSFLNVSGEWGKNLKRLAMEDRADGPMATLRREMTNLYQKSGKGNLVGGLGYSNKEQNIASVTGVAYSMMGESTPDTLYQALTQSMMEDGFLSRFLIIEYGGDRPPLNMNKVLELSKDLTQAIGGLCSQAITNNTKGHSQDVIPDTEANDLLTEFDKECDRRINSSTDEAIRQMWNRAHLKVLRLAAGLAVFDNWHEPIIRKQHAEWALMVVRKDIAMMNSKLQGGDIGSGDDYTRMQKTLQIIKQYYAKDSFKASYGIPDGMRETGIVPHRYLQMRTSQVAQFRNARQGATKALFDCIRIMLDNGYIQEVAKEALMTTYAYGGKAYRVISLPPDE